MARGNADHRYEMLDAIRGMAAIIVMLHHAIPELTGAHPFHSGYLAVDFFFMLSGLVIANAWETRLASGAPLHRFARSRLRRVYPTMAVGILAGVAVALIDGAPPRWLAIAAARHLLLWPTLDGATGVFPLDGVEWSLLFELFANAVYATLLFRLSTRALIAVAAGAAVVLVLIADPTLGIGFGDRPGNLLLGAPRVIATYTIGVLLHRYLRRAPASRVDLSAAAVALAVVAALLAPGLWRDVLGPRIADPVVALGVFPGLILIACRVETTSFWRAAGQLGAALSFPIYAIHLPVLRLVTGPRVGATGMTGVLAVVALTLASSLLMAARAVPAFRPRTLAAQPA